MSLPAGDLKPLLGVLAMNAGWISSSQLMEAISEQAQDFLDERPHRPIGRILVARRLLSEQQVKALLERQAPGTPAPPKPPVPAAFPEFATLSPSAPVIFGKYLVLRQVSQGTTGDVFEALDSKLGLQVALKIFYEPPGLEPAEAAQRQEWFVREAKLSTRLPPHPHIVHVYETGVDAGRRFIAMEFIDGPSLAHWLDQDGVTLRRKVSILRDVSLAVQHTHEHGILHRDLKPANVLVDAKGLPHIADFGIARALHPTESEARTISGMLVGTPAYMSPEQAQGKRTVDERADVYSLGVMLYEMLTGRTPFGEKATIMTLVRMMSEPPPAPARVLKEAGRPPVDAFIERVCLKAMAGDPRQRHPSAQALADDLAAWLDR